MTSLEVGEAIGWVLPRAGDPALIAGLKSGFALLDLDDGGCETLGSPEADRPDNRLNDAKVDNWGRIWTGTGICTDAEGCIWIAHWGGGRISRFAPDGGHLRSIELPASNITSCAFAGENLDRMFVTSSTIDHDDEPLAGALFEVDPGVKGVPVSFFAG